MRDFEYEAPTTLKQALDLLSQSNGKARLLAGGTDLIDQVRIGRLEPDLIIDVKKIPELNVLLLNDQGLRLGAAVPCSRIYEHADLPSRYSALADSVHIIGGIQIQNRASVGGNICNSGPAADTTPSVIALGGVCVIAGPNGNREVPAEDFCTGPGKNVLQSNELLTEIRFPSRPSNSGSHYRRFIPRNEMDIAVVGVGASVELSSDKSSIVSARIAIAAVPPTPLFVKDASDALAGQTIDDALIKKTAEAVKEIVSPITDMRGTKEYRVHLSGVLTERVLNGAISRAKGEKLDYRPGH